MNKKLSHKQIKDLSNLFIDYKNNKSLTTQQIANKLRINRITVGNYFRNMFGEDYTKISKTKHPRNKFTQEQKLKISLALKGKPKPPRSLQHRMNLSKSLSRSYIERFGEEKAKSIKGKISNSNKGKKRIFKDKEI